MEQERRGRLPICHLYTLTLVTFEPTSYIWWRRQWHPTPILLPGKSHGRRGLVGCSPWGRWESDTIERLHFHLSLSCIGEGNGNPLQCSCLENPRDGEPGGLPSVGSHGVGHNWCDSAAAAAAYIWGQVSSCFDTEDVWARIIPGSQISMSLSQLRLPRLT